MRQGRGMAQLGNLGMRWGIVGVGFVARRVSAFWPPRWVAEANWRTAALPQWWTTLLRLAACCHSGIDTEGIIVGSLTACRRMGHIEMCLPHGVLDM